MPAREAHSHASRRPRSLPVLLSLLLALLASVFRGAAFTPPAHASRLEVAAAAPYSCLHAAESADPVATENTCPGTRSWLPDRPSGPLDAIEGGSFICSPRRLW
jgi:hypothetical protein